MTVALFCGILKSLKISADVAELAYAYGSGPYGETLKSSTLFVRTKSCEARFDPEDATNRSI